MLRLRLRFALRWSIWVLIAAVGAAAVVTLVILFRIRLSNEWQCEAPLPAARMPRASDRIVIFAPHSDDETLACGGLLMTAAQEKAKVRVVLLTNGDGFRVAVGRAYKTVHVTPQKCIDFAYKRQKETVNALEKLGIGREQVTFLGYPDRGLAALWDRCWGDDALYVSHATKTDYSPYNNSFTPRAPHCGESLLSDIQKILKQENPTCVYIPHPCDNHSDHYATYCFVTAALEQIQQESGKPNRVKVFTYLVHRGDWPCPRGLYREERLAPPYALARTDTKWSTLDMPEDMADAKLAAIRCYKTQTAVERGFLQSFARRNEVFGQIPVREVVQTVRRKVTVDGDPGDWSGVQPCAIDAVGDYLVAGINKGGDVRAIYLCSDENYLYARLDFARKLSKQITYDLKFRGIGDPEDGERYALSIRPGKKAKPAGTVWAYKGNVLEVAVPLRELTLDEALYVQVKTRMMKLTVDNTGWRGFELEPSS